MSEDLLDRERRCREKPQSRERDGKEGSKEKVENKIHIDDAILLSNHLSQLVNSEQMSDVTFIVGQEKQMIFAHRVILAARSPVFAAMLYGGLRESHEREILVPNIRPAVFRSMLEYIYGGKTVINTETAVELLAASNQYEILNLVKKCGERIRRALSVDTVCQILDQTQGFSDIFVMCVEFIEANAASVFASEGFLALPESTVIELVRRDHLSIQEIELFHALIKWGKHKIKQDPEDTLLAANVDMHDNDDSDHEYTTQMLRLRRRLRNIIPHVRLPLIPAADLVRVVKPTEVVPTKLYLLAMEYLAAPNQVVTGDDPFFRRRLGFGPLFGFSWQPSSGFEVDGNTMTALRTGEDEWRGIFGSNPIYVSGTKIFRFEIKIRRINPDRSGMVIGLAKIRDRYSCCWGYGGSGYSYPSQTRAVVDQSEFQANDIIGVHLDNSKRQVSFYRNGSLLFINSRLLPLGIELYPAVYMHYVGDEVRIRC